MVRALKDAFDKINELPPEQQEAFASFILEELAAEQRWSDVLAKSKSKLGALANEALNEYRRGQTKPFETDGDLTDN
jgi:hypothetical protein